MRVKIKPRDNPEIDISFSKHHNQMDQQQTRLTIQILRVNSIQKQRMITRIFTMTQPQLCSFFTNYQLFPQEHMDIQELLDSDNLKLIKSDGKIYFGQIDRKKRCGRGVNVYKEGKVYEGEFDNNEKSGRGVEIYPNGNLFMGEFLNNKKHGKGRFFWFNLSSRNQHVQSYQGDWWGGLPDGDGIHQKINGDMYVGIFKNGLKHGEGIQYFGNGDYYKGEYINGMPQGYGQYLWHDASAYKGDFKQGLRNGYGVWQMSVQNDAQSYRGHYCMDKKSGYGVYTWQNQWSYKGNFDNDFRNGFGELYNNKREMVYRGFWENGEQSDREGPYSTANKKKEPQSIQFQRYQHKQQRMSAGYQHQTRSRTSIKPTSRGQFLDFHTISTPHQYNLNKRPQSLSGCSKTGKQTYSNSYHKSYKHSKGTIGTSINRPLMATIKSGLYVPCRSHLRRY